MTFTQERMTKQQQQQMQDKEQEAELHALGGMISIWEIHFWPEKWQLYDLDLPPSPRLSVANEGLVWNLSDPKNVMPSWWWRLDLGWGVDPTYDYLSLAH